MRRQRTEKLWGKKVQGLNRRNFLKAAGTASAATLLGPRIHALEAWPEEPGKPVAANDHIQIALIGAGGQGQYDTRTAVEVPGVKLVAVDGSSTARSFGATTSSPPATIPRFWRARTSTR